MSNDEYIKRQFVKRINKMFEEEKISKRKFSKLSNINTRSLTEYLNGLFFPRYDTLIKLANYFEVSIDYILGISDNARFISSQENISDVPKIFRATVSDLLRSKNMTEYKFAKALDIGQGKVTMWLKYESMPETPMLIKIAKVLDCSVDFLLGRA